MNALEATAKDVTSETDRQAETLLNTIYNEVGGLDSNATSQLFADKKKNSWTTEKLEELMSLAIQNRMVKQAVGYAFLISVSEKDSNLETRAEELSRLMHVATGIQEASVEKTGGYLSENDRASVQSMKLQIFEFFNDHPTQRGDRDVLHFQADMEIGDY